MTFTKLIFTLIKYKFKKYQIIFDNCYYGCPLEDVDITIDKENKIVWFR